MINASGILAQSITRTGSIQTYYTARLLVDKDLIYHFYRAYAYFRWVDDVIDIHARSDEERISFISRQRKLIDALYRKKVQESLVPEEEIIADLINHDNVESSGLQSFIGNMFAIIEFDAFRKEKLISKDELDWYTERLGQSVTDGIQYFVGNGYPYPMTEDRVYAATAAHITHLLRDMILDIEDGFINIPREYLEEHNIGIDAVDSMPFRDWVRARVDLARDYFQQGKQYLDGLDVLRCKIAGYWYCARFEGILDIIERDGYRLRASYNERRRPSTWIKIVLLVFWVTFQHLTHTYTKRKKRHPGK